LIDCYKGILITGSGSGVSITGNNNLIAGVRYPLSLGTAPANATFYHNTIENTPRVITAGVASVVSFTNSIFANITALYSGAVTLSGEHNGFYNSPTFGNAPVSSGSTPFQSVGAGNYYLVAGSSFRDYGVSNTLSGSQLQDLSKRTTFPPLISTNSYAYPIVLNPQAQRDSDAPDLGYHYDPIDYAVYNLTFTSGASLTLTNGVALAMFGNDGIWLQDGSQMYSEGTPNNRNHLARYYCVQEQPTNWGAATLSSSTTITTYNTGVSPPIARIRFTDFDGLAGCGHLLYLLATNWTYSSLTLQDCSFNSGQFSQDGPATSVLTLTNNLFERVTGFFENAPQITAVNNLFRYGTNMFFNTGTGNWIFKDNAFDSARIDDIANNITASFNAYINMGTNRFYPTNSNDLVLTNFSYATGPLGNFYQPTNSPLINLGSLTNASQGVFYQYTTTTNQTKEATSRLDIGLHYIATDRNGNPIDTDIDGVSDYFEDRNGNGSVNSGETDWQIGTDLGLKVWITEPKSNSNLP
jgi:hypothetical protein